MVHRLALSVALAVSLFLGLALSNPEVPFPTLLSSSFFFLLEVNYLDRFVYLRIF